MKELVRKTTLLAEEELINANAKFPMFRSTHEGYAIIKEEIEETVYELEQINETFARSWHYIKQNCNVIDEMVAIKQRAINLAAESIQVAAMAQKFIDSEIIRENTRVLPTVCSKCKDLIINDERVTE